MLDVLDHPAPSPCVLTWKEVSDESRPPLKFYYTDKNTEAQGNESVSRRGGGQGSLLCKGRIIPPPS